MPTQASGWPEQAWYRKRGESKELPALGQREENGGLAGARGHRHWHRQGVEDRQRKGG